MVLSFKLAKTGTRYQPKPKAQSTAVSGDGPVESVKIRSYKEKDIQRDGVSKGSKDAGGLSTSFLFSSGHITTADAEVSFTLNLFLEGYSIIKPTENLTAHRAAVQEDPKLLHPYDRASETFFAAVESGRFPGGTLDDIPCKYVNGTIVCEVQDYRKCASERGLGLCVDGLPSVHKLCLRMSLENVVKDIPLISDDSWTYGDLMEAESRILKALQPSLCLDPTPKLDRLCEDPTPKLNLDISSMRKKRLREVPEVTVTCHTNIHGKKVCIDKVPENSNGKMGVVGDQINIPSDMMLQQNDVPNNMQGTRPRSYTSDTSGQQVQLIHSQQRYQMNIANARLMQDHGSGPVTNVSGTSSGGQDILSYTNNINITSLQGKRENHDGQLSPLSNSNKRPRLTPGGPESISQQHIGSFVDGFQGQNSQWKNSILQHQLQTRGMQYTNSGVQKYQSQVFDGLQNQDVGMTAYSSAQGTKFLPKEEQIKSEKMDVSELGQRRNDMHVIEQETINLDPQQLQFSQRLPQNAFNRSGFSQAHWNNLGPQIVEKKEDNLPKRKLAQSPRVSAGSLAQSPLSGEFSSGSLGAQFGVGTAPAPFGTSQMDKSVPNTVPTVGGMPYMTSSGNDSMQRQQPPKRRTNSLPKTQGLSGVASPASVSTTSVPLNANSPVGTPPLADQIMLERFTKIEMISNRYNLNAKKNKIDNYPRKPIAHSSQLVAQSLAHVAAIEDVKDDKWPLSKSIVSGSMNELKIRVLNFIQPERVVQGSVVSVMPRTRTRLIMTEKSNDGSVAMHFGEIEDSDFMAAEDYLHTLPNTHKADLLAAQSCSLLIREGYHVEDHIQLKPVRVSPQPSNQQVGYVNSPNEMQQFAEGDTNQAANQMAKPKTSDNVPMTSNQSHLSGSRILPPGNQALQMSQGLLSGVSIPARPQQLDQQSLIQQQAQLQQPLQQNQHSLIHQQQPQFQRPALMMGNQHLSPVGQGSNMQLGNQMVNKQSPMAMQILQQQQQQQGQPQQQQAQMQRKLMMGLGNTMGIGNMGNNLVGLGGMSNVMNMGAARGISGVGMSAPMGAIAGVGNMGQNPVNMTQNGMNVISQQLRNGQLTRQQAEMLATKFGMVQGRTGMLAGPNPQANMPGVSAARQMHPSNAANLAMLGHRANMNPMQQRSGMGVGPMGPPKLMAGVNPYRNQQQQQQHLQFQQMQQQLQLQQQQQQQQMQPQQPQQQVHQQHQMSQSQPQPPQDSASPLQSVVTPPPQVSSPSTLITAQQQVASPSQQMSQQRTPMSPQLSSGAVTATSVGGNNPEAGPPTSPQLSSQTHGSVGSISNSPMELQGVNKSN